jgi:sulfite reductase (ferredoxin)
MSRTTTGTTPGTVGAPVTRPTGHRGEGQWALGHHEPLNPNERVKSDDDGLNVRRRIEAIYSVRGFASVDPADLNGRFRWWGLYTQRRAGIDGGRTALLEPHELSDEFFMLRVRSDGGRLNVAQLRAIADISTQFGRDSADLTDRQNVQLHWIRIEDVPEIWRRLEDVGLSTAEACGDTPRVVLGSPVAGVAADEILDGTPAIDEIVRRYVGDPELSNLPRKLKTAISGSPRQDVVHEVNDVSFVGVRHPQLGPGFDLWVGGGLSTNPMLAQRLGAFVTLDEVPEVWAGVVRLFRDYGYRRLRAKARLKFLVNDWGIPRFRAVLESEYLGRALTDGPAPTPVAPNDRDHVGVHEQRDGRNYIGAAPLAGRVSGSVLRGVADLAQGLGSDRIRLTPHQKIVVLDIASEQVAAAVQGLEQLGLTSSPDAFRRGTMACTGIEYCKLAIVETKARAADLVRDLSSRDLVAPASLSLNINGCPNSCARVQVADIGLKGQLVTTPDGRQVEGFQVHLGGVLGENARFGRKPRGLRVAAEQVADLVVELVTRYEEQRAPGEAFAQWVVRAEETDLLDALAASRPELVEVGS